MRGCCQRCKYQPFLYIYVHIYVHVCVYKHTHFYIYIYICTCIFIDVYNLKKNLIAYNLFPFHHLRALSLGSEWDMGLCRPLCCVTGQCLALHMIIES